MAESARKIPDVVGDLSRRLPLSRATIVHILKSCDRLEDLTVNPAVFIDRVTDAISRALYDQLAEGIVYQPTGQAWSAHLVKQRHQEDTVAPRVVKVKDSITDHVVCDSEIEEKLPHAFLDSRSDIPLFLKLPEWFKIPTPLGSYNPDWAFVHEEATGTNIYLVRETKGGSDPRRVLRWESEGWKIKFGAAHFRSIGVDFAFGHDPTSLIEPSGRSQ